MRIEAIQLTWFRGAADEAKLEPKCKSMVIYGENASGKSSFVDAIEYALKDGKIGHLSHEYSGKRQEKGIINTHVPDGQQTGFSIRFKDGSEVNTTIMRNGSHTTTYTKGAPLDGWDYRRTVLRQDEVAEFIRDRKGEKYSAILPLLGLGEMEVAAENVRQLSKRVSQESNLSETQGRIKDAESIRKEDLDGNSDDEIVVRIEKLHSEYCKGTLEKKRPLELCVELEEGLKKKIGGLDAEQRKHIELLNVGKLNLRTNMNSIRAANEKLAKSVEPFIAEKLAVLDSTDTFVGKLGEEDEVECPACGRPIRVEDLQIHVNSEKERLQEINAIFTGRRTAINALCDTVTSLRSSLGRPDVRPWCAEFNKDTLAAYFTFLQGLDIDVLRSSLSDDDLRDVIEKLQPLIDTAAESSKHAPPDALKLSDDRQAIAAAEKVIRSWELSRQLKRSEILISYLDSLEMGIRDEIRQQSQKVIDEISSDIQRMWGILHPGEPIEEVTLYIPEDTDKAIDIGLKFHGVAQDSPRLTLSEGYRNSLGLCIFLSMAKCEKNSDRPLFLDDVVNSLDRNHRGMIVELLEKEFSDRQVVVLTHDREWYTELRQLLDQPNWLFKPLMPFETPEVGIRWSAKVSTFDDARALLDASPDSAAQTARKIMDIELALHSQPLKLRLPYLHREKNDRRMVHEFLDQLIADGKTCFRKRREKGYSPYSEGIEALRVANKLLLAWGNRASHTFSIDPKEAKKLIAACEHALEILYCQGCKKPVHFNDNLKGGFTQCRCGELQWRY